MTTQQQQPARVKYPTLDILLPPGRLIRGSLTKRSTTDHKRQPLPENKHHFWFAVAIRKDDPRLGEMWGKIYAHTLSSYQQVQGAAGVLQQIGMGLTATAFAWKMSDGDLDPSWKDREGAAGCIVVEMRGGYSGRPINCYEAATGAQLDPAAFQLGDVVDASVRIEINGELGHTAGIFISPGGVRWIAKGQRITTGPDYATQFGTAPVAGAERYSPDAPTQPPMSSQMHQQPGMVHQQPGMVHQQPGMVHQQPPSLGAAPSSPAPMGQMIPASAGGYGVAAGAPGALAGYGVVPSPAPMNQPVISAEMIAAQFGVQHHPGYRYNPATRGYEPDQAPAPTVGAPAAPVGAPGFQGAASAAQFGQPGIASLSSPYGPGNPPPFQPHQQFGR